MAKEISGSYVEIGGRATQPKNQIDTSKIRQLGFEFGSSQLLWDTVSAIVQHVKQ